MLGMALPLLSKWEGWRGESVVVGTFEVEEGTFGVDEGLISAKISPAFTLPHSRLSPAPRAVGSISTGGGSDFHL